MMHTYLAPGPWPLDPAEVVHTWMDGAHHPASHLPHATKNLSTNTREPTPPPTPHLQAHTHLLNLPAWPVVARSYTTMVSAPREGGGHA